MAQAAQGILKLVYWHTRARAMPIRFLLEYLSLPYEEKIYQFTPEQKAEWHSQDKPKETQDFPNLPYLVDGDFYLSESLAILQYVADKSNDPTLVGGNAQERARIQQALLVVHDFRVPLRGYAFGLDEKQGALDKSKTFLNLFDNVLKKQSWIASQYLTYADFYLYEVLLMFLAIYGEQELSKFLKLLNYLQQFEQIPRIAEYLRSEKYQKYTEMFPAKIAKNFSGVEFMSNYNKKFVI